MAVGHPRDCGCGACMDDFDAYWGDAPEEDDDFVEPDDVEP